jgi:hypothetical protein
MGVAGNAVRVKVQTAGFWCEGDLVVPAPGGYKGRVLDLLNGSTEFLALTDVDLHKKGDKAAEEPTSYDVLILRKGEIEFVVPMD